jgi:hypothetical protein
LRTSEASVLGPRDGEAEIEAKFELVAVIREAGVSSEMRGQDGVSHLEVDRCHATAQGTTKKRSTSRTG